VLSVQKWYNFTGLKLAMMQVHVMQIPAYSDSSCIPSVSTDILWGTCT
jgi:hypothetical protein